MHADYSLKNEIIIIYFERINVWNSIFSIIIIVCLYLDNENEKFSNLPPSSHGSLSSITTTSIASSEDPKGGDDELGKERRPSKVVTHQPIKQEEWWKTTLQVSIPFMIAGIGTIGAGIILGRVEVSITIFQNPKYSIKISIQ